MLNGEDGVAFGEWWQSLHRGLHARTRQDPADRDAGFLNGKYAISLGTAWAALQILNEYRTTLFLPKCRISG